MFLVMLLFFFFTSCYFTGYEIIDILVGAGIALYIIYSAYELIHDGILVY